MFSEQQIPEISDMESESTGSKNTTHASVLDAISQNEMFQEFVSASDSIGRRRDLAVDDVRWRMQHREAHRYHKSKYSDILNAKSARDIREQLELFITQSTDTNELKWVYSLCMQRCGALNEFEEGFRIFEDVKQRLNPCPQRMFGSAMRLTMEQDFSVDALNKCFALLQEMKTLHKREPTPFVYSELLRAAISLKEWNKARKIVKEILSQKDEVKKQSLRSHPLCNAIINYYAKSEQISKGLEFMNDLVQMYGSSALKADFFSIMLAGIALRIKSGDKSMLKTAELLFEQYMKMEQKPLERRVFNALLTCYSSVADIDSCLDMLNAMMTNSEWPNPDNVSFSCMLNAIIQRRKDPIEPEKGWEYVDNVLALMEQNNIEKDPAVYACLFHVCGGSFCRQSDLERLYMFYDEMEQKNVKLSPLTANSLLMAGVDHFCLEFSKNPNNSDIKRDLVKHIDWTLLQFKKYGLTFTNRQNVQLKKKLAKLD